MSRRRMTPTLETLDSRQLLSAVTPIHTVAPLVAAISPLKTVTPPKVNLLDYPRFNPAPPPSYELPYDLWQTTPLPRETHQEAAAVVKLSHELSNTLNFAQAATIAYTLPL
jgi:hypothetical protein